VPFGEGSSWPLREEKVSTMFLLWNLGVLGEGGAGNPKLYKIAIN